MATNNACNFANPIAVANGGTGDSTLTTYAPLCGGTSSTGALQQATTGMGSSGNVLTSQGASALPQWSANTATAAFVLIQSKTASTSASIAFDSSHITSTYTSYAVIFNNLKFSTGGSINMTFSTNNGVSYLSTNYQSSHMHNTYNSTLQTNTSSSVTGRLTSTTSTGAVNGIFYINIPQSAIVSYIGNFVESLGSTYSICYGNNSGTTTVNNIKFAPASGTISSGTFSLYGITQ